MNKRQRADDCIDLYKDYFMRSMLNGEFYQAVEETTVQQSKTFLLYKMQTTMH